MKIDGSSRSPYIRQQSLAGQASKARPDATRGESVRLSGEADLLQNARQPERTDRQRVEKLRLSLSEGTFEVDPYKIADAMLREERLA